jgi:hypothetical protein
LASAAGACGNAVQVPPKSAVTVRAVAAGCPDDRVGSSDKNWLHASGCSLKYCARVTDIGGGTGPADSARLSGAATNIAVAAAQRPRIDFNFEVVIANFSLRFGIDGIRQQRHGLRRHQLSYSVGVVVRTPQPMFILALDQNIRQARQTSRAFRQVGPARAAALLNRRY